MINNSRQSETADLLDRLRTNLRVAGIPVEDADIAEIVDRRYLDAVAAFERLATTAAAEQTPDYLASRAPESVPPAAERSAPVAVDGVATVVSPSPHGLPWSDLPERSLRYASLLEIARMIRTRQVSPVELTEQALAAIDAVDREINAFQCLLREQALAAARVAEAEIAAGVYRGPLHGVPMAVKDLLAMRDTVTTAGSRIFAETVTDVNAAAVESLRGAGAVIVGKTRLSEFAYALGSINAHYGPTRNPWNPEHDTGGSSSGSAAAVAAGLVYAALGTDTGGSIRGPGAFCGLVGLKPTHGRCSLFGCVPLSWSLDHIGPLTRSVADAALLLEALAGHDPRDARTRPRSEWRLREHDLDAAERGLRLGVLRDDGSGRSLGTPPALAAWRAGIAALEQAGAHLVEIDLPELEALRTLNSTILVLEAAAYHRQTLRTRFLDYGPFPRRRLLHGFAHGPLALAQAEQVRAAVRRSCDQIWERVDLLTTPTMPDAAPPLGVLGATTFTAPFNCLGWPAVTVPVGFTSAGLPLGLQLAGKPWDEATVLRGARAIEAAAVWRR